MGTGQKWDKDPGPEFTSSTDSGLEPVNGWTVVCLAKSLTSIKAHSTVKDHLNACESSEGELMFGAKVKKARILLWQIQKQYALCRQN